MSNRFAATIAVTSLSFVLLAGGCSSDTTDNAKDAVSSASDDLEAGAQQATASSIAESFRVSLKGNNDAEDKGMRSVEVLQQVADDLPGDPDITGIDDGDGDGLDDDGKIQVTVSDEQACISVPETGTDTTVTSEAC